MQISTEKSDDPSTLFHTVIIIIIKTGIVYDAKKQHTDITVEVAEIT